MIHSRVHDIVCFEFAIQLLRTSLHTYLMTLRYVITRCRDLLKLIKKNELFINPNLITFEILIHVVTLRHILLLLQTEFSI